MKDSDVTPGDGLAGGEATASLSPSLLERLRARDDGAWRRLEALYGATVRGWCRRWGLAEADAADAAQEVFGAVVRGLADFRRDRPADSFRGWLWTVARNKARDHWRRQGDREAAAGGSTALEKLHQLAGDDGAASEEGRAAEEGALYRQALDLIKTEFEERTWRAFLLVTVEERPAADVAAELGMSPGAVYVAKSRVLKRLREEFADLF